MHVAALVDGEPGEWLVEQQHLRFLRQRHGDFDAAALAIGSLRQRPMRNMAETDALQRRLSLFGEAALPSQIDERVPALRRQAEQSEPHVVDDGVLREQSDDLIGARHAEMGALAARRARDVDCR